MISGKPAPAAKLDCENQSAVVLYRADESDQSSYIKCLTIAKKHVERVNIQNFIGSRLSWREIHGLKFIFALIIKPHFPRIRRFE